MSFKIHIANDLSGRHIIHYTLQLIAANKGIGFIYTPDRSDCDLLIDDSIDSDLTLENAFYQNLTAGKFLPPKSLQTKPLSYRQADEKLDILAAIFYLVNCLQEYNTKTYDKYGRYPYIESIQMTEGLLQQNLVQGLIDELFKLHPKLSKIITTSRRSGFFLTHDIDTVYGAKNQNGDHALKTHQYHKIPKLLWNHYLGTPDWINMDRIMAIEQAYGFTSTFYWLVHRDKQNADYDIGSALIQRQLALIKSKGFEIGLHKSLRQTSFQEEAALLGTVPEGQRYHFLKFNLPQAWDEMEAAGIRLDTSLGFSEGFGFRNSYGLPFMPYHLAENRVYDLIEVPMNIMDGNFFYQNKTVSEAENSLIDWLDKNKENTVITINFHNNFFDDMLYAGYENLYKVLLSYFKEEGLTCMTQKSLLAEYCKPGFYDFKSTMP
jgi:hypothetical protein